MLRGAGVSLFGHVASWFGILAGLALIPVYTFYFLLEKRGISSRWTDYLPVSDSAFKTELVFVLNSINNYLIAFFRGQVLVAICDGILYGLGFLHRTSLCRAHWSGCHVPDHHPVSGCDHYLPHRSRHRFCPIRGMAPAASGF